MFGTDNHYIQDEGRGHICALWPINSALVLHLFYPRSKASLIFFLFLCLHLVYLSFCFLAAAGTGGGGGGGRRVESAPPQRMIGLATPSSQFRTPLSGGGRGRAMPMNSRLVYSVPRKMS